MGMARAAVRFGEGAAGRVTLTVLVSALGYFVDVYDLVLFSIYRAPSLKDLLVPTADQLQVGMSLMNTQMAGMIFGGALWGVLGDRRGRTSVLFGSILVYSLANIGNAFVTSVGPYFVCRFFAGFGLAGEIGAAVTLVSEVLSRDKREVGSGVLFSIGVLGAVAASLVSKHLSWRTGYLVGGGMGLSLLIMRWSLAESSLYDSMVRTEVRRGSITTFFAAGRWRRLGAGVLIGVPTYFGSLVTTYLPEFAKARGVIGEVTVADGVMFAYAGVVLGVLSACVLSRRLASRRKAIFIFMLIGLAANVFFFTSHGLPAWAVWVINAIGGYGSGYLALYITATAEMFGTNLRATAATMVPAFVRATTIPMTLTIQLATPRIGLTHGALALQTVVLAFAFAALLRMPETFGKDLSYVEN